MRITLRPRGEFADKIQYRKYLSNMADITTPTCHKDWENNTYSDICYEFCQLRNSAKKELNKLEESLRVESQTKGGLD